MMGNCSGCVGVRMTLFHLLAMGGALNLTAHRAMMELFLISRSPVTSRIKGIPQTITQIVDAQHS